MESLFKNSLAILASTSFTISSVLSFTPSFESISHVHYCTWENRLNTSRLYAFDPEHNLPSNASISHRSQISTSSDFIRYPFEGLDDFSLLFDDGVFDGTFPMLQEQADALAFETFEENESLELDASDNCGDDCKECEIPKDWCVPGENFDVMEYLGVTRVKPLC
jgi:hypothetical protein